MIGNSPDKDEFTLWSADNFSTCTDFEAEILETLPDNVAICMRDHECAAKITKFSNQKMPLRRELYRPRPIESSPESRKIMRTNRVCKSLNTSIERKRVSFSLEISSILDMAEARVDSSIFSESIK